MLRTRVYLSTREAAKLTGYSEEHLRELVRKGKVPHSRPSGGQGRYKFDRELLEQWMAGEYQEANENY